MSTTGPRNQKTCLSRQYQVSQAVTFLMTKSDSSGWDMAQARALQPWVESSCTHNYAETAQDTPNSFVSFGDAYAKLNNLIAYANLDFSLESGQSRTAPLFMPRVNSAKNITVSWFALDGTNIDHSSPLVSTAQYTVSDGSNLHYYISACVIDALRHATPVNYTVDSGVVSTDVSVVSAFAETTMKIGMSLGWANAVTGQYLSAMP